MAVYRVKVTRRLVLETTVLVQADTVTQAMDSALKYGAESLSDDDFDVESHDEDARVMDVVPSADVNESDIDVR